MIEKDYLEKVGDVFGIEQRLVEIDDGYRLFFNKKLKRYEVHNEKNIGDSLSVVCPFECVDRRLVEYVRRTRSEKQSEIIAEIEKNNAKIEKNAVEKSISDKKTKLKDILHYLNKKGE